MIVTLTANTTMDLTLYVPELTPGLTIRATRSVQTIGGKPTDCAWILGEMGIACRALGFAGGTIGERITALLREKGVAVEFIPVDGESRINNVIIDEKTGLQTTITTTTLTVSEAHIEQLRPMLKAALAKATCLVLGGTLPAGMTPEFYTEMVAYGVERGVPVILDCDEPNLSAGLASRPKFIKPNRYELGHLTNTTIDSLEKAYRAGREVIARYGTLPVITLDADGLLAVLPHKAYYVPPLPVTVVSAAGAGDAVLAGLAAAMHRGQSIEEGIRLGAAAAAAVIIQPGTAVCTRADIERFLPQVTLVPYGD
jgi:1-phosphofructokinase family hexose kinase